jgi:hypothetical protein
VPVLNFYDKFYVRIEGKGELFDDITEYFNQYLSEEPNQIYDIDITVKKIDPQPDVVLGAPNQYYGKSNNKFIIKFRSGVVVMNKKWDQIVCSPSLDRSKLTYLIEYKMRRNFIEDGRVLIHASGVEHNGATAVFPAWRHTGKTNTMISILKYLGGSYLSDDRVWVDNTAEVWGYNLPVNMLPYNYNSFPELKDKSIKDRISNYLDNVIDFDRSIIDKAIYFLSNYYLSSTEGDKRYINDILPEAEHSEKNEIDDLIFLVTEPTSDVTLSNLDTEEGATMLKAISQIEWNDRIGMYCQAYDSLFKADKYSKYKEFVNKEESIFVQLISSKDTYRLSLPREEQWNEKNIDQDILKKLNQINDGQWDVDK